jgi:hypothetical protein
MTGFILLVLLFMDDFELGGHVPLAGIPSCLHFWTWLLSVSLPVSQEFTEPTTTRGVYTLLRSSTIRTKSFNQDPSDSSYLIRQLEEKNIQLLPCPIILWNDYPQSFNKKWSGRHKTVVYWLVSPSSNCDDYSTALRNLNTMIDTTKSVFPQSIHFSTY